MFTDEAQHVVVQAHEEAIALGWTQIGSEHLLLGVFSDPQTATARALGGPSWMLRRSSEIEFRGVRGAGWVDVLTLQAEAKLRLLLIRAGAAALDDGHVVIQAPDLLTASAELPEGAELFRDAGVTPVVRQRASTVVREWIRISADKQVIAALVAAQRGAIERNAGVVTVDDLLLALVTGQRSLLSQTDWEIGALRTPLEQRLSHADAR